MDLDVHFDVICPWCYLGHTRLAEALGRMGPDAEGINLRWRAFQLDPGASSEPGDLRRAIDTKYGPGAFDAMTQRLVTLGTEAGIDYRFDRALRVGTRDAHRLVQWAQATSPERATPLVERLYRAYFTDGANVADPAVLAALAGTVGLPADEATEVLSSDGFAAEVQADLVAAREAGITGVPAVVLNGATIIPGAQDVDTMERILRRVHAKVGQR